MSSPGSAERDALDDDVRRDGRDETATERADRNWSEVLQELRVMQTGSQILAGFLLALAFQPAFADLTPPQRTFYLALVLLAGLSAIAALAPVALHRMLFRRLAKPQVVAYGHACLIASLATAGLLVIGVVGFVFLVVLGAGAATVVAVALAALVIVLWIAAPIVVRVRLSVREDRR